MMKNAVLERDNNCPVHPRTKKSVAISTFSKSKGMPNATFANYACADKFKRKKIGTQVGAKPLLEDDQYLLSLHPLNQLWKWHR